MAPQTPILPDSSLAAERLRNRVCPLVQGSPLRGFSYWRSVLGFASADCLPVIRMASSTGLGGGPERVLITQFTEVRSLNPRRCRPRKSPALSRGECDGLEHLESSQRRPSACWPGREFLSSRPDSPTPPPARHMRRCAWRGGFAPAPRRKPCRPSWVHPARPFLHCQRRDLLLKGEGSSSPQARARRPLHATFVPVVSLLFSCLRAKDEERRRKRSPAVPLVSI
jgi:hypothetical protein